MKKSIKHILFFVLVLALAVGSTRCDKEEDSPKLLLTGKQWNLTAWTTTPPYEVQGEMISDLYALLPVCAHDDFTVFNTDGTAVKDEGEIKCGENEPQTISGTWLMNANQTRLKIILEGSETEYVINELSDNYLILSKEEVIEHSSGTAIFEHKYTYTRM